MQAWALNSATPTARLNKQKQNRSRTSASNHAFDSKLHYRVCSWTGTAIACPVSAEEKAPQQAGYAAMNGFLPAGHASPAPMSAPAPVGPVWRAVARQVAGLAGDHSLISPSREQE